MTAWMFGALQSTMEDGAWGVEHCLWVVGVYHVTVGVMPHFVDVVVCGGDGCSGV